MPWSSQGGGGGGPGPRGPQPPNIEDLIRKTQDRFKNILPGGFGSKWVISAAIGGLIVLWGLSGLYRVALDEQGVVLRFGKYVYTTEPGLHWRLPAPLESHLLPKVTRVHRVEVGTRVVGNASGRSVRSQDVLEESLMLTGDENIVDMDFTVLWRIRDAKDYLFRIRAPDDTVKIAAESAMREVVGQTSFDNVVTIGRQEIEQLTRELLQDILDRYEAGITIQNVQLQKVDPPAEVIDAFNDVQRARQDKDRLRNEAESYANAVVPKARGDAEQMIQAASAYKEQAVMEAEGEAKQFLEVYNAYKEAPVVTRQRMYLETLGEVLRKSNKIILDSDAGGGPGVVPYLPLPEVQKRARQQAAEGVTQ